MYVFIQLAHRQREWHIASTSFYQPLCNCYPAPVTATTSQGRPASEICLDCYRLFKRLNQDLDADQCTIEDEIAQ